MLSKITDSKGVQQLLPSHRMVVNVPCKLHNRIIRLPRPTLRLADPWSGDFSLDLPMVQFTIILTEIILHNSHGHTMTKTGTTVANSYLYLFNIWQSKVCFCQDEPRRDNNSTWTFAEKKGCLQGVTMRIWKGRNLASYNTRSTITLLRNWNSTSLNKVSKGQNKLLIKLESTYLMINYM